jgi:hypothetical protein
VFNIGNGLGQSLFLMVTLCSGQEDGSSSLDNHLLKIIVVKSFEEWSILEVGA